MVFKNFTLNVIFRVALLAVCITLLAWCIVYHYYLRSFYIGAAVIVIVVELIKYVDRFNGHIKTFMVNLLQNDFTTYFDDTGKGKSFNALYKTLNQITAAFKKISGEKEIQHRYLEMLVDHVQVGILSFDKNEKIQLANDAVKKLLQRRILSSVEMLASVDAQLLSSVRNIQAGQTKLIKVRVGNELLQLSLHAAEFKLENEYFKLISLQNIRSELDAHEMEAWQKLIRVMTHEIMNSISPITSLSETLHGLVKKQMEKSEDIALLGTLDQGLDAIRIRSEGLHHFTEAYRRLTRIPTPVFRLTNLNALLGRVKVLLQRDLLINNIKLLIQVSDAPIMLDAELIEQVFINLLRNAIDALGKSTNPMITIAEVIQPDGKVVITIIDNGTGINSEIIENIFVPFFTTKKNGSGIGLALAKQILQLHHADIKVYSIPGVRTELVLLF
ncbi:MAG: ATP-binding protein [Chryseolinea sp.]